MDNSRRSQYVKKIGFGMKVYSNGLNVWLLNKIKVDKINKTKEDKVNGIKEVKINGTKQDSLMEDNQVGTKLELLDYKIQTIFQFYLVNFIQMIDSYFIIG